MKITYGGNVSRGGNSSVNIIWIGTSTMAINFLDRAGRTAVYDYDKSIIGTTHFVNMKALAINGVGLNEFSDKTEETPE